MSETLSPDAAERVFRSLLGLRRQLQLRFAAYVRRTCPDDQELAALVAETSGDGDGVAKVLQRAQDEIAISVLRRKAATGGLPAEGPVLSLDDFAEHAGELAWPFLKDLEQSEIIESGGADRAKAYVFPGAPGRSFLFQRALFGACRAAGVPDDATRMMLPLIVAMAEQHPFMDWPREGESAPDKIRLLSKAIERASATSIESDDLFRALMREFETPARFLKSLDTSLLSQIEAGTNAIEAATIEAVSDDPDATREAIETSGGRRSRVHSYALALRAFLREELEAIWGKDAVALPAAQ